MSSKGEQGQSSVVRPPVAASLSLRQPGPDGVALLEDGYVHAVDQGLSLLTGCSTDELLGLHWQQLFAEWPEGEPALPGTGDPPQTPLLARWRRKDGCAVDVVVSMAPLCTAVHTSDTMILSVVDAARWLEQGGAKNSDRGERPRVRSSLLADERQRTIGTLTASIAHELNNPLCGVRSVIERMIRKTDPAGSERSLLDLALEQCDRMRRLLQEVQAFVASGPDLWHEFDLHATLDAVLLLLNKQLKLCGVQVRTEYGPEPLMVRGVDNQMKQLLLTLIKGCGEALGQEGGELRIRTGREDERVWCALVGVDRQGLGTAETLFLAASGTVLEGSLADAILRAHDAEIRVAAVPSQGPTLAIYLPTGN